jgi:hypothetical protein
MNQRDVKKESGSAIPYPPIAGHVNMVFIC